MSHAIQKLRQRISGEHADLDSTRADLQNRFGETQVPQARRDLIRAQLKSDLRGLSERDATLAKWENLPQKCDAAVTDLIADK